MGDVTGAPIDPDLTPAALLIAWRALERRRSAAGAPDGPALTVSMRELMDRYDWAIGGRVGPPPGQSPQESAGSDRPLSVRAVPGLSAT